MADEKKPELTPREKIAKLSAMSPEEFNQFMMWNFNRICKEPLPSTAAPAKPDENVGGPGHD